MEKECRRCFKSAPLSAYYKHGAMFDGYLNVCKECTKKRIRKHREDNIERIKEYDRNRPNAKNRAEKVKQRNKFIKENDPAKYKHQEKKKTEWAQANKVKVEVHKKKWRKENPEKRRAHIIVGNAVRDGRLIKPEECSSCKKTGLLHGHHDDYSKPLEVKWLCPDCHRNLKSG